ncbi:glucosamine inositolphosphorylceramide transferase family protein [Shinella sp.]|uniref:glucosamine inositolphosphorylceramide transferase family protein n=1 Tax=Shinella sp. TaxID=1870904 RepID=UPI003F708D55
MTAPRLTIDVVIPARSPRGWQKIVIQRLDADGHDVAVLHDLAASPWPDTVNAILGLERTLFRRQGTSLAAPSEPIPVRARQRSPVLRLDLAGDGTASSVPTLALRFGQSPFDLAIAPTVAAGELPVIEAVLDGHTVVGRALPMIDRREATSLGVEDVLARAVTLLLSLVHAFAEGPLKPLAEAGASNEEKPRFLAPYVSHALPRLGREALRRMRFHHAHWRIGYRFHHGPGVAETGRLGTGWKILPDSAGRFYADPFVFHWQGRPYLFVEDYVQAARKAVISVVSFDDNGTAQTPRVVLEEPHHLSYPQVFERDGAVWMLPEASASGRLTLYRATGFPDRWHAEAVLLEGEISDATLLEHEGSLWLFATSRDGFGSTSDTLAVFQAPTLLGPWRPHALNPILIDRRRARPGGAFHRDAAGRILLPVQDGTLGYGGGLGLSELLALDGETVRLGEPQPILAEGDWPYPRIHTLNRSGPLEVIDGIAAVPKRSDRSSAS